MNFINNETNHCCDTSVYDHHVRAEVFMQVLQGAAQLTSDLQGPRHGEQLPARQDGGQGAAAQFLQH